MLRAALIAIALTVIGGGTAAARPIVQSMQLRTDQAVPSEDLLMQPARSTDLIFWLIPIAGGGLVAFRRTLRRRPNERDRKTRSDPAGGTGSIKNRDYWRYPLEVEAAKRRGQPRPG